MRKRDSRNSARLMIMLVTLILIMVIVIVSLLARGRVWNEQEETTSSLGETILAGDHEADGPSLEETTTAVDGREDIVEDGDPLAQDKSLPQEGHGAEVEFEEDIPKEEEKAVLSHGIDVSKWQG